MEESTAEHKTGAKKRFGVFEFDPQCGELTKHGVRLKMQAQPLHILEVLLEHAGQIVSREKLHRRLWPGGTFVEYEQSLNKAVNKLREALGDSSDHPLYIETLPRRGYRFLVPVETAGTREFETAGRSKLAIAPPDRTHTAEDTVSVAALPTRQILPWAVASVMALVAGIAFWGPWRAPPIAAEQPFLQMDLDLGSAEFSQAAISPDGMRIVFVSKGTLAIRRLDQAQVTRLSGVEGASYPFFSPNGQWVAFFAAGKLQKVALDGSAPITLCDAPDAAGGTWSNDDNIIAALNSDSGLSQIPAAGGTPQPLTNAKSDPSGPLMHRWPQALPGGKGVLFAATNGSSQGSLRVLTPKDGKLKTLVENSTYGRYLASGYLVYYQRGTLLAAPMDANRLKLTGPAVPLVYGVSILADRAEFDLSHSGTLIYRAGTGTTFNISWLYSSGKTEPVTPKPGHYLTPRLSPDGKRLALALFQEGKQNIWVYDLSRETWTRLTSGPDPEMLPTWTPDGEFLAFRSGDRLAWTRSDGSGKVEYLTGVSRNAGPWSFSADGKWLAFWPLQPGSDLFVVPVERTPGVLRLGRPQPLLEQVGAKGAPAISPDGRWVAYTSAESGQFEIYVMPFSPRGTAKSRKWPLSNRGGWAPIWSQNGRDLFYQTLGRQVQVASYTAKGDSFAAEKPRLWSETLLGDTGFLTDFDVAPDGKRVLALFAAEDAKPKTLLRVLLNVASELRRRTPTHGK